MGNTVERERLKEKLHNQILQELKLPEISKDSNSLEWKTKCQKPSFKPKLRNIKQVDIQAKPILHDSEGVRKYIVSGKDGRYRVLQTEGWPHSVHGVVYCQWENGTSWGTGSLIAPHLVLTAAHNLYCHKRQSFGSSILFGAAINGRLSPFGEVKVIDYYVPEEYIKTKAEDYAVLLLEEPIGEQTGHFGLAFLEEDILKSKEFHITGYPADKVVGKSKVYEMWEMKGQIEDVQNDSVKYKIDTGVGQNGSGIWYKEKEDCYIIGVQAKSYLTYNEGTLITRNRYEIIRAWAEEKAVSMVKLEKSFCLIKKLDESIFLEEKKYLEILCEFPLEGLISLSVKNGNIGSQGAEALAKTTTWINLQNLDLSYNKIDEKGAEALVKNTTWNNLQELNLSGNNIGEKGNEALAKSTTWGNLEKLSFSYSNIGEKEAEALAKNTSWIKLRELNLSGNNIGEKGIEALTKNITWINLNKLDLSYNNIGGREAEALAKNTIWMNLQNLDLSHNNLNETGAKALAKNTSWINLRELNLTCNSIGIFGAEALMKNTFWINLRELDLNQNNIGGIDDAAAKLEILKKQIDELHRGRNLSDKENNEKEEEALRKKIALINLEKLNLSNNYFCLTEVETLAKNSPWIKLRELNLSGNKIDEKGAEVLATVTTWINLRSLDLSYNNIGEMGAEALAKNRSWINLQTFNLADNKIGEKGAEALAKNTTWINLQNLILSHNNIGKRGAEALAKNTTWVNLRELYLDDKKIDE